MTQEAGRSNHQLKVEQDLLNALMQADGVARSQDEFQVLDEPKSKIPYVWNPADPESEAFFNALEQEFALELSDEEVAARSKAFSSHIDQLFAAPTLKTALAQKFANVPQQLLSAIARHAQQVAQSSNTLADQLVQCVQEVLPQWAEDDLQVLARPLAYAMRGDESDAVDATVSNMKSTAWDELSETEQARLSLAIARYALNQIDRQN